MELRPADADQTDEGDLMPYDILDRIERHAIRDKRAPKDCLALLREELKEHAPVQLTSWNARCFPMGEKSMEAQALRTLAFPG